MTDYADTDETGLPFMCYGALASTGELILMRRGQTGYWPAEGYAMGPFDTWTQVADFLNDKRGVTRAQRAAMEAGSMFGFDCAAADPTSYDDLGQFIANPAKRKGAL